MRSRLLSFKVILPPSHRCRLSLEGAPVCAGVGGDGLIQASLSVRRKTTWKQAISA